MPQTLDRAEERVHNLSAVDATGVLSQSYGPNLKSYWIIRGEASRRKPTAQK